MVARRFPDREFDLDTTKRWLSLQVLNQPMQWHAARTDDAACLSVIVEYPWSPDRDATVIVLIADPGKVWQTPALLRDSLKWARLRGAVSWRYQSDTQFDIAPLMRRIGVPQGGPRFKIELRRAADESRWH